VAVTSSEIGRATSAGDNYGSNIYRAKLQVILEGRRSTVSLIVKAQPLNGKFGQVNTGCFKKSFTTVVKLFLKHPVCSALCYISLIPVAY
jgi:hypothetical protein